MLKWTGISRRSRLAKLAVCAAVLASVPPVSVPGSIAGGSVAHAADKEAAISKEQAVQIAKSLIDIPDGFVNESVQLLSEDRYPLSSSPVWLLRWQEKGKDRMISATVDAATGKLLNMFRYEADQWDSDNKKPLNAEEAGKIAADYLKKAAGEEMPKLSKANEYTSAANYYTGTDEYLFFYTRVENDIPFPENGIQIVVNQKGQITNYNRNWYEGSIPQETVKDLTDKLKDSINPSLQYVNLTARAGDWGAKPSYRLVYQYSEDDPAMLDAVTGEALTSTGFPATKKKGITPLGTAIRQSDPPKKLIDEQEAENIANQWIKKFLGEYQKGNSRSSGSGVGPEGIVERHWGFSFLPAKAEGDTEEIRIEINDRGEFTGYSSGENYTRSEKKTDSTVSLDKAEESAVNLVKIIYQDRLGEIYLIDDEAAKNIQTSSSRDNSSYTVQFGWLKAGVPVENARTYVDVDAVTGKAVRLWSGNTYLLAEVPALTAKVDKEKAIQAEAEHKEPMLTYFIQPQYLAQPDKQPAPKLVYRYLGEQGFVDAVSGEWISLDQLRKQRQPQDLEGHPAKEALQRAMKEGYFAVQDGKVEPEREVTRAEYVSILLRLSSKVDRPRRYFDEEVKPMPYHDVNANHPNYAAIQQGVNRGIISDQGQTFAPDSPITRIEASEMLLRLFGYGPLLGQPELFAAKFSDVPKQKLPAAVISDGLGLWDTNGKAEFQPNSTLSRADVALLIQKAQKLAEERY
ncbi:S-layer homology domain-containing protein [Brevibacillus sp. B_LB10_24]|uniref:S-layer homology domain-containing protein n=1 Tax=Brevibacillus sp. B_LB10_24 TaxID=3380645 RepID=UPI0038BC36B2